MKMYRFIFLVGFINLLIPFLGIPFMYKQYIIVSCAIFTLVYALIARTVQKEKESFAQEHKADKIDISKSVQVQSQKIEDVIEMQDTKPHFVVSDIKPMRKSRKSKVLVTSNSDYE